jgi:hypothetical protein
MLRDIPVFREVAGDAAFYFGRTARGQTEAVDTSAPVTPRAASEAADKAAQATAESIKAWLSLYQTNQHPLSTGLKYNTWQQSVEQLKTSLFTPQ